MYNYVEPPEIITIPAPAEGTTAGVGVQIGYLFGVATNTVASTEMVSNGRFTTDALWTKGVGWSIANGVATSDASQAADSDLSQSNANLVSGQLYLVKYTLTRSAGNIAVMVGGTAGETKALSGTYTEIITAGASGIILFRADLDFAGTVDLVSVVHVTNIVSNGTMASDTVWTKGVGWTIAAGVAACDGTQVAVSDLSQAVHLVPGAPYWTQFKIAGFAAGTCKLMLGGNSGTDRSANAVYTQYLKAGRTGTVLIRGDVDYSATTGADNVIVAVATVPETAIAVSGIVDIAKPTALAVTAGDKLWFDPNLRQVTKTATASVPVGIAVADASNQVTTVKMLIKPIPALAA